MSLQVEVPTRVPISPFRCVVYMAAEDPNGKDFHVVGIYDEIMNVMVFPPKAMPVIENLNAIDTFVNDKEGQHEIIAAAHFAVYKEAPWLRAFGLPVVNITAVKTNASTGRMHKPEGVHFYSKQYVCHMYFNHAVRVQDERVNLEYPSSTYLNKRPREE